MSAPTCIVFGPSGRVGSSVARQAHQLGARVVLALRDPAKPIPALSPDEEKAGQYSRVQADLLKPETVEKAVREVGAKHAFIYGMFGSPDYMRSTIEALKAGGITFIVFLSSCTVGGDLHSISPTSRIPYMHAQVEIQLDRVVGNRGYVALRPGFFTSNVRWWTNDIRNGNNVEIAYPQVLVDFIAPQDIGKVAATLLVQGYNATEGAEDRNAIYLTGPKLRPLSDAFKVMGQAIGKDIEVREVSEAEAVQKLIKSGIPEGPARSVMSQFGQRIRGEEDVGVFGGEAYDKASANLHKYAGTVTSLEEWAEQNKSMVQ